jgi:23S rRNA (cytosine1962-C5)-methyltransferase
MYKTLKLKKGKEIIILRKHPWIFSGALQKVEKWPNEGEIVEVLDHHNQFLAMASYHRSNIALRILSFEKEKIDKSFFINRLESAKVLRKNSGIPSPNTNCYRFIHGEGDGLSGLIIDIYGNTAVIQCHNLAIYHLRKEIAEAMIEVKKGEIHNIYSKSEKSLKGQKIEIKDDYLLLSSESPPTTTVLENGIQFTIDWISGQKTGFFLDQRENRKLLRQYCENKKVLNCFSYTGGFTMYALKANAHSVASIDISEKAINILNENARINNSSDNSIAKVGDVMEFLKTEEDNVWDIVIVDPPAFAKNISKKHNAVIAYKRLNALAIRKVKSGGLLFTFSCSQVVDTELFYNTITAASIETGRNIRVIHKLMQGPDHPINIYHPEGSYLKGLVLYIE